MGVKEAARTAKIFVRELFADEGISNIRLEEVDFQHLPAEWMITVGFLRPSEIADLDGELPPALFPHPRQAFKVVRIRDHDGKILSVKHRDLSAGE